MPPSRSAARPPAAGTPRARGAAPARTATRGDERNRLLARLPSAEYARLAAHLAPVTFPARHVVYEPGAPITHVYFPQAGMFSLVLPLADGGTVEVGMVGREGMAGIPAVLGVDAPAIRCIVQLEVRAQALRVPVLRRLSRGDAALHVLLKRYVQTHMDQIAQGAACNRRHTLERRCARWLLMSHDRAEADAFPLTQEFLAYMLGVHRPAVVTALGVLRNAGLVESSHERGGGIRILDRPGLERAACECYAAIRRRFDAVFA